MIKQIPSRKPTLWILIILFSLPWVGAYYLNHHSSWLKQLSTTNYGRWVSPAVVWNIGEHHARPWQLVLWMPKGCDQSCLDNLNQLAKVRLAMGRKVYLLDVGVVLPGSQPLSETRLKDCQTLDIRVNYIDDEQAAIWRNRFVNHPIILFSPEHQSLLMYSLHPDSKKLYHDLQQLIK